MLLDPAARQSGMDGHAVVIGGGIAGLLAARVVLDRLATVTLLDRDRIPDGPEDRRGVPQGRHAHGLLAAGCRALEELFPGIPARLKERGALPLDIARDARWFLQGGRLSRPAFGLDALLMSLPLLEAEIRARVLGFPAVRLLENCAADQIAPSPDGRRVLGVRAGAQFLPADLVIDASGRGSRAPQWLEALGFDPPREERIEIGLGYTTRWFRRLPWHLEGDLAAVIPPPRGQARRRDAGRRDLELQSALRPG